jgi:hypothetical protein
MAIICDIPNTSRLYCVSSQWYLVFRLGHCVSWGNNFSFGQGWRLSSIDAGFKCMHLKTHGYAYKRYRYVGICTHEEQIPVAARSKTWVFGHSLAGIAGSNPAWGIDVCLLFFLCCQVEFSASGWSLLQRSSTERSVSECDREASKMRSPRPPRGCHTITKKYIKEPLVGGMTFGLNRLRCSACGPGWEISSDVLSLCLSSSSHQICSHTALYTAAKLADSYPYINTSIPSPSYQCSVFGTWLSVRVEYSLCVCMFVWLFVCLSSKLDTEKVRLGSWPFFLFKQLCSFRYVCMKISLRTELPVVGTAALNIWSISDCIVPRKCHTVEHSATCTHIRLGYVTVFPHLHCNRTWLLRISYTIFGTTRVGGTILQSFRRTFALCLWNHDKSNFSVLIIVQRDATQSSIFTILQVHSTFFGCQPHTSSGVHKTITTASGTVQLPLSNVFSCTKYD